MSIYFEKIPLPSDGLFLVRTFEVPFMSYPMHYHSEIEITFIKKSHGQRFVGDHVEYFSDGDLVMIGSNLPHQWQNDVLFRESGQKAQLTVIHFREDIFGDELTKANEFAHIKKLLMDCRRGVRFPKTIGNRFEKILADLQNCEKDDLFIQFIRLLNVLAKCDRRQLSSSSTMQETRSNKSIDKINNVYSYILENYRKNISLTSAAKSIHMSDSAFSHFIKKRTGMTFSNLLNDLRIRYAGKLLKETDLNITEICYKVGYRNLSYFNRQFRRIKRCAPKEYRNGFNRTYLEHYEDHKEQLTIDK